jgi:hypothetical protein
MPSTFPVSLAVCETVITLNEANDPELCLYFQTCLRICLCSLKLSDEPLRYTGVSVCDAGSVGVLSIGVTKY